MFLLSNIWLAALFFHQLGAAAHTYTIDQSCLNQFPETGDGFQETFNEVTYQAGQFAEALTLRDTRYNDIMKWFFGFDVNSEYTFYVIELYLQIASLKPETGDHGNALVHDQARWVAVDDHRKKIPMPSDPAVMKVTRVVDEANDSIQLADKVFQDMEGTAAMTRTTIGEQLLISPTISILGLDSIWEDVTHETSKQNSDRATIDFMSATFTQKKRLPPTWRRLAKKKLSGRGIIFLEPSPALILTHELSHIHAIGALTMKLDGQSVAYEGGLDWHGPDSLMGYYLQEKGRTLADQLENNVQFTLRNPDSYAYALTLFALFGKQWRPYWDTTAKQIRLEKDKTIPLQEDWPGAKPLSKRTQAFSAKFGLRARL
ncbi:hypothetical protein OPT61_g4910 [Boeremia exigua]|uniref:Uncharacterized protein n=1 Tax=Boeremia exigua TaxID=749465 RepID=A0ACC2ICB1_9PLEO|nr:hypothetical protein OPT61_g4910 [Boeremia exigua]